MLIFFSRIIGVFLILLFFSPMPGGIFFSGIGLSILICSSLTFALWVKKQRQRFPKVNKSFYFLEGKLGERWAKDIIITRPEATTEILFEKNKRARL